MEDSASEASDNDYDPMDVLDSSFGGDSDAESSASDLEESDISSDRGSVDDECQIDNNDDTDWVAITAAGIQRVFSGTCGLQIGIPRHSGMTQQTPKDVFSSLLTQRIIDGIVEQTNLYAQQWLVANRSKLIKGSRASGWHDVTREEIQKFFGIIIVMGLNHMQLYWSKDPLYGCQVIKDAIARDRFIQILTFLHFADNRSDDASDRLYKVRQLLEALTANFQSVYLPGSEVVVDETMFPWRGRLVFRQYNPSKRHKYGIKLYKLCTPSAYTWNCVIYGGQGITDVDLGHSGAVVMHLLTDQLKGDGRVVYTDNFYTSIALARQLVEEETFLCGTLRKTRKGNPGLVVQQKLQKGHLYGLMRGPIRVMKYSGTKDILMLSTLNSHDDTLVTAGKGRFGDQRHKPQCVSDYNHGKKGVDVADQMDSYFSYLRCTIY